jgi:ABC-type branched-subunit amino acid transport system permease subunit
VLTILILAIVWEFARWFALRNNIKLSEFRMIIYSLSLVSMMLLRPQGLLGGRELWPKRLGDSGRLPSPTEDRQDAQAVVV